MKTILVIEDEQPIRTNILKLLEFEGFQAVGASDGRSGIQMAKAYLPDLIICDIMMPEIDGYGVLTALRNDPQTVMIPLIFLSAKADMTDLRQGMDLGADDYLVKPFTSAGLLGAIAARLEKQAAITQPYIDEMKQTAANLAKVAYSDPLTGLSNRILLRHNLQERLRQVKQSEQLIAVLCLNLDRFRSVNAQYGHGVGDTLLQAMASRLQSAVGPQDLVARLGGDEFSLVLCGRPSKAAIEEDAQRLLDTLLAPYQLNGHAISIDMSLGIALYPEDGTNPDQLLTDADTARRWSKKQTGPGYQFYDVEMDALNAAQLLLETDLAAAIERSEFELHYQPQIDLMSGNIVGVETLLRWRHPSRGLISPITIITAAEESGLIVPLGDWILRTACAQATAWPSLQTSVNLSARQFKQRDIVERITAILQDTGLEPSCLAIELTETSVMDDVESSIKTLQRLKLMGIEISIDDFGTGYSSLNYLKRLPLDTLKIDRSFIRQVSEDSHDAAITTAIIAMAQQLKLMVIAEGVETQEQLAFLQAHGCHRLQGFLFSPAVPAEQIQQMLLTGAHLDMAIA